MLKKLLLILPGLLLLHSKASSELYRWNDERGSAHFSDQPPLSTPGVPAQTPAAKPRARFFPVPQHGNLVLSVPESWDQEIRQSPEGQPPTIVLTPRQGDDFEVLITPSWSPSNEPGFNNPQVTKRLISASLAKMLPTAIEREVHINEIQASFVGFSQILVLDFATSGNPPRTGAFLEIPAPMV